MMMSFCRKMSPHSFLGLTPTAPTSATTTSIDENLPFWKCHPINSCLTGSAGGGLLGLVTATNGGIHRQLGLVLESSSVKFISSSSSSSSSWPSSSSSSPPSSPPPEAASSKKDPGGIGFIDDIGGGVDGLMSCTESLGFESSDERRVDDQIEGSIKNIDGDHDEDAENIEDEDVYRQLASNRSKLWRRRSVEQLKNTKNEKKFPPPISSLNQNGQPSFYLRPVRKDGRLELTEVRIYRPEILRAYRQDGRLRLHLVRHDDEDQQDQLLEDCIEEEEEIEEIVQEAVDEQVNFVEEDKNSVVKEETSVDGGEWKLAVGGGEGYRRCQKAASRHHHHHHGHHHGNMGVWRQQRHCVTTR